MGAEFFTTASEGETSKAAFESAVKEAQYNFGHAGYTGTIAEKSSFIVLPKPDLERTEGGRSGRTTIASLRSP